MKMVVLILGGIGFVGAYILEEFRRAGYEAIAIDRRLDRRHDFCDPQAAAQVIAEHRPHVIVHAAGATHGASPELMHESHVVSTLNLMNAVAQHSPGSKVLVVGSAAELGLDAGTRRRWAEVEEASPSGAYGLAKREQSRIAREVASDRGLHLVRVRVFNTLGPGQSAHLVGGALVERLQRVQRGEEQQLAVHDPDSERDFLDIRDVARILRLLSERLEGDPQRPPVNVCSGVGTRVGALARMLVEAAGIDVPLCFPSQGGAPTSVVGDDASLRELLAGSEFQPISVSQSLLDMWHARIEAGQRVAIG